MLSSKNRNCTNPIGPDLSSAAMSFVWPHIYALLCFQTLQLLNLNSKSVDAKAYEVEKLAKMKRGLH